MLTPSRHSICGFSFDSLDTPFALPASQKSNARALGAPPSIYPDRRVRVCGLLSELVVLILLSKALRPCSELHLLS